MKMGCDKCNAELYLEDELCLGASSVIFSRGYYWHLGCCVLERDEAGEVWVQFPSSGKLIPSPTFFSED